MRLKSVGFIPPNGSVEVVIVFQPVRYVTAQAVIELETSDFGSKPFRCQIEGSCQPVPLDEAL